MAAPSTADATMGDAPTPDRASTPEVAVTTDSSDHGTPPPQTNSDFNYHFNHSTPGNTVYYNPTTVMDQLHITENQTTTAPPLANNIPYTHFSLHLHLKSTNYSHNNKLLHWHNWTTHDPFTASLEIFGCHTTIPHCSAFHYLKQPTSTTTTRLHSTQQLATTTTTSSSNSRLNNHYS